MSRQISVKHLLNKKEWIYFFFYWRYDLLLNYSYLKTELMTWIQHYKYFAQTVLFKSLIFFFFNYFSSFIIFENFNGQNSIERRILGSLLNIADVCHLRNYSLKYDFILLLRSNLYEIYITFYTYLSICFIKNQWPQNFEISHLSAGIFSHLCSDGIKNWSNTCFDLKTMSFELVSEFSLHYNL